MKWLVFILPLALPGCSGVDNTFVVEDEQRAVVAANLLLCGEETPLRRSGGRLSVSKTIECEGTGRIALRYATGSERNCLVDYVTPGALQGFTYRASEKGCEVFNHFVS